MRDTTIVLSSQQERQVSETARACRLAHAHAVDAQAALTAWRRAGARLGLLAKLPREPRIAKAATVEAHAVRRAGVGAALVGGGG